MHSARVRVSSLVIRQVEAVGSALLVIGKTAKNSASNVQQTHIALTQVNFIAIWLPILVSTVFPTSSVLSQGPTVLSHNASLAKRLRLRLAFAQKEAFLPVTVLDHAKLATKTPTARPSSATLVSASALSVAKATSTAPLRQRLRFARGQEAVCSV